VNGSPPQIISDASRNTSANPIVIIICASGCAAKRRRNHRSIARPIAPAQTMAASAPRTKLPVRNITVYATYTPSM
jgi:hypothetical protein